MEYGICPICNTPSQLERRTEIPSVKCSRCGDYWIGDRALDQIETALQSSNLQIQHFLKIPTPQNSPPDLYIEVARKAINVNGLDIPRSIISHALRKRTDKRTMLTGTILANIIKNNSLPTPAEIANNFITQLGLSLHSPGDFFKITPLMENIYGLIGLRIGAEQRDVSFIVTSLKEQKIIDVTYLEGTVGGRKIPEYVSLTLAGWQKYEELQHSVKNSRKAFVAMEFPSPDRPTANYYFQNTLLDQYLVPAVRQTDYDLANALRTEPTAGNIHARLEVEIRKARFVVAELSHQNNGAYWEAGFARGLSKPVIYMYNKEIGGSDRPPHFDVSSDHYIAWEQDQPQRAADALKAVIRATLFEEAKMND